MKNKEKKEWSPEQLNAINSVDKDTLVSASAGSGKTELMMEKVSRLVLGKIPNHKEPMGIKKMMIVTFTKAVAKELKVKVVLKLTETMQEEKAKAREIRNQIEDVAIASISTIDSLCTNMVRNYFDVAKVDPTFTIMDEDESALYLNRAINRVIELNDLGMSAAYVDLKNFLGYALVDNIKKAYAFVRNKVDYIDYLKGEGEYKDCSAKYLYAVDDISSIPLVKTFYENYIEKSNKLIKELNDAMQEVKLSTLKEEYKDLFYYGIRDAIDALEKVANAKDIAQLWDVLHNYNLKLDLPRASGEFKDFINRIKGVISQCKESNFIKNQSIKDMPFDEVLRNNKEDEALIDEFISILLQVDEEYSRLKEEENELDFNDVEQKTIVILKDETIRKEINDKYDYICVDEYQDINPLQERILKAVSRGNNLFMVGDIKQSIYGFRQSDPTIFVGKYHDFKANGENGAVVELNKNYRSRKEILDFVNKVFNLTMSEEFGSVDYKNTAQLKPCDDKLADGTDRVKIKLFKKDSEKILNNGMDKGYVYSVKNHIANEYMTDETQEADYIINKIKSFVGHVAIKGKALEYKDIAILFRARNERVQKIVSAIQKAGIPVDGSNAFKETKNSVISLLISFLSVIDNDKQDAELVNVLLSVFGGFNVSDLAKIRKEYGVYESFFYDAFNNYSKDDEILKKKNVFINKLNKYRQFAKYMTVDELIKVIIDDHLYDAYVLAQDNGESLLEQLKTFINTIENKSYNTSVSRFLSIYREYSAIDSTKEATGGVANCVQTSTVHGSKGLQYPVVFLIDTIGRLNNQEPTIVSHKEGGFAIAHLQRGDNVSKPSFLREILISAKKKEEAEENLRGLYVALTRPREYLFITGTTGDNLNVKLPQEASCYYDWINYARENDSSFEKMYMDKDEDENVDDDNNTITRIAKDDLVQDVNFDDKFISKINDEYPHEESTKMPIWYSVTKINKEYPEENSGTVTYYESYYDTLEDNGPTSTSHFAGTAYHKVLEIINYKEVFTLQDVEEAIDEMVRDGKLTYDQLEAIDAKDVFDCLNSTFMKNLREFSWQREKAFKLYIPANEAFATTVKDKVLVQGTFDLFIPDKGILVDYKLTQEKDENKIRNTYIKQMNLYKKAIEYCTGDTVNEMYIYVIHQNRVIKI